MNTDLTVSGLSEEHINSQYQIWVREVSNDSTFSIPIIISWNCKLRKLYRNLNYLVTPRYIELRFPAAQGGILLMRSLAVQPLSFLAFFRPLYSKSWSLAITTSEDSPTAPPAPAPASCFKAWSEDEEAMENPRSENWVRVRKRRQCGRAGGFGEVWGKGEYEMTVLASGIWNALEGTTGPWKRGHNG